MSSEVKKSWGGKRPGAGRVPGLTEAEELHRAKVIQKFSYMSELSDKLPIQLMPVEVPCQSSGCFNMTEKGIWQLVRKAWSVRPICDKCIRGLSEEAE